MTRQKGKLRAVAALLLVALVSLNCKTEKKQEKPADTVEKVVPEDLKWSERMALSEIHRFPDPTLLDFQKKPRWSYTNGLVLQAMSRVHESTPNEKIYGYIYEYADRMVNADGSIKTYKQDNYNLDMIKSGDVLFYLNQKKEEPRFKKAMDTLHRQLLDQPLVAEGGYWHKKRYPHQMWLDGLYMAEPFHAKYAAHFMKGLDAEETFDKIVLQFDLIEKHSRDPETGLYYHGWDASKEQRWADKETGLSPHFWSRGMGWYGMALVDIIELLPENHPGRARIIGYLNRYAEAIVKYQDSTGTWYQVLDLPEREGNYLEATGTCMFTYTLAKGVNKGYLPEKFMDYAKKGYEGILTEFVSVEDNGVVNLNRCCGVAGLGGDPYRDGSFDYYVNEIIRSNDPKGTGPFMMASLELDR
ncbi:glycoside hydrolase family 88/105 protein [Pseudozobellia thermophila]|uniref:Unsaturated rhamnogalacturonyl hydrolase n=1 Tax=Pseudozobellia thermophila TaxID=192903 RepID=A0A1M6CC68_9FLAO|nr:glycoside hydrolase family 88 protein [Pseudozobellia thermophila]SHI58602.1 unsaturated rhamnogalacturonyl hydrolase [Pseudozobellia thermophila]